MDEKSSLMPRKWLWRYLMFFITAMVAFSTVIMAIGIKEGMWLEGLLDFLTSTLSRMVFISVLLLAVRCFVQHFLVQDDWGGAGSRTFLIFPVWALAMLISIGFMVNPLRDVIAMDNPPQVTLYGVQLNANSTDDNYFYNVSGVNEEDEFYNFRLSSYSYQIGWEAKRPGEPLNARVVYLPYSKAVVRVTFFPGHEVKAT